jgi:hypothetical protein
MILFHWAVRPLLWIFWGVLRGLDWTFGPWTRADHAPGPIRAATDRIER